MDAKNYDELEQYYYVNSEYIEQKEKKYSSLIGKFVINFSRLENEINLAIADIMFDDDHSLGFSVITELTFSRKINFFYHNFILQEQFKHNNKIKFLNTLKNNLVEVNSFRNSVIHANWESLTKEGFVHTKILLDSGFVKFKKVKLTPQIIRQNIKKIDKLLHLIDKYKENFFQRI